MATQQRHRYRVGTLELVLVLSVIVVFCTMVLTIAFTYREGNQRKDTQIAACERGNVIRAKVNTLIVLHPQANLQRIPLVDCVAVVN